MIPNKEIENHIITANYLDTEYLRATLDDMDMELFEMTPFLTYKELQYREFVLYIYEQEYKKRTSYTKIVIT